MTILAKEMPHLDKALFEESWEWLQLNVPVLAAAVHSEVRRGATPEEIRRHVMLTTQRAALALRCQQAAAHLMEGAE